MIVRHCVLRNWDRILGRAVKGLMSRAGMVSRSPLPWQRDVKPQQTRLRDFTTTCNKYTECVLHTGGPALDHVHGHVMSQRARNLQGVGAVCLLNVSVQRPHKDEPQRCHFFVLPYPWAIHRINSPCSLGNGYWKILPVGHNYVNGSSLFLARQPIATHFSQFVNRRVIKLTNQWSWLGLTFMKL